MNKNKLNETSKFLSYLLRHEPQAIGLQLDSDGWADINDLINNAVKKGHPLDLPLIQQVVNNNDKKRFSLSGDGLRIRAVQGHSSPDVKVKHIKKEPPENLFHGTATRFLESIFQQGLIPRSRHHVHLSQDIETATAVGKRYGEPVILKVESLRMHQLGFDFFQAENGVWLTETVPTEFISK